MLTVLVRTFSDVAMSDLLDDVDANDLIVQPSIDGLFTGRAAWQADKFNTLIRDAIKAHDAK